MLELKQVEECILKGYGDDIKVKPYITTEEMEVIVNNALEVKNLILRDKLINLYILTFCTDIPKEEIEEMDYNLAMSNELINKVNERVANHYDIYGYISKYESMNKIVDDVCKEVLNRMPKDMDKFVSKNFAKIKKMMKNGK